MGLLIGVPIPDEYSADSTLIENAIQEALIQANKLNIKGKQVTPFLLEKILPSVMLSDQMKAKCFKWNLSSNVQR